MKDGQLATPRDSGGLWGWGVGVGDKISREVACRVQKGVGMIGVRVIMILIHSDRYNATRVARGVDLSDHVLW